MRQKLSIFYFVLLIFQVCSQIDKRCCASYDATNIICLTCPPSTFLSGNNCIVNINGCQTYTDCFTCSACAKNMNLVDTQINTVKTKKCQESKIFTEINVADPTKNGQIGEGYLIVNDFFRSSHPEIISAPTLHALHQKFQNGTQIITIQYENNLSPDINNKFFRGTMIINLSSFIFKQIEFKNIPESEVRKILPPLTPNLSEINQNLELNTKNTIGSIGNLPDRTEKLLTLNSRQNSKLIEQTDLISQGTKKIYQNLIQIKLITLKNGTQLIQANYKRFDNGTNIILIDVKAKSIISITQNSPPPPPPPIPTPIITPTPVPVPAPIITPPSPVLPPTLPPQPKPIPDNIPPSGQIQNIPGIPTPSPNPPPTNNGKQNEKNNGNRNGNGNGNGNSANNGNNGIGKGGFKTQTRFSEFGLAQMKRDSNLSRAFEYARSLDNKIVSQKTFISGYSQRQLLSIIYKLYFKYDYRIYEVYFIEDLVRRRNILRSFNQVLYVQP